MYREIKTNSHVGIYLSITTSTEGTELAILHTDKPIKWESLNLIFVELFKHVVTVKSGFESSYK